jgi:hypothetical protein
LEGIVEEALVGGRNRYDWRTRRGYGVKYEEGRGVPWQIYERQANTIEPPCECGAGVTRLVRDQFNQPTEFHFFN